MKGKGRGKKGKGMEEGKARGKKKGNEEGKREVREKRIGREGEQE